MLRMFYTLALRNLLKQKLFSFINVTGLALGLASCLLILLYVADELSYDRFHPAAERTYRIRHSYFIEDKDFDLPETSYPLAQIMRKQFPGVEMVSSITAPVAYPYRHKEKAIEGIATIYGDASFLAMFDFPLLAGNPKDALTNPRSIVISKKTADNFFDYTADNENYQRILGELITLDKEPYIITAIIEDVPTNSHLHFDAILSMTTLLADDYKRETWLPAGIHQYVRLKEEADPKTLRSNFLQLEKRYLWPQMQKTLQTSIAKLAKNTDKYGYYLEPLEEIYLIGEGHLQYVYIFSVVGLLLLLLACANFINLSTARAAKRLKEIGIRKTLGSSRRDLIGQFMAEALLQCLLAGLLAIGILILAKEPFSTLTGKVLNLDLLANLSLIGSLLVLSLFVVVLAGGYPAFYLSCFDPIEALKGNSGKSSYSIFLQSKSLRNVLVAFQFCIACSLIVGVLFINRQLSFMQSSHPGFKKENIVVISNAYSLGVSKEAFKQALSAHVQVEQISYSYSVPSATFDAFGIYKLKGSDVSHQFHRIWADESYLPTYGMKVLGGRNFSKDFPSDSSAILLNTTAAQMLGRNNPIGMKMKDHTDWEYTVIGIVEDFHFEHFKNRVKPLVITLSGKEGFDMYVSVRLKPGNMAASIQMMEKLWRSFSPEAPFSYTFMEEKFNRQFSIEQRTTEVMEVFTGLTMMIACLGLFGLATFVSEQRLKEMSIRKVLGASKADIVATLSKDFLQLILLSFAVCIPFSWIAVWLWLGDFAYRIELDWKVFAMAGATTMVMAALTLCYQFFKVATINPVENLKNE